MATSSSGRRVGPVAVGISGRLELDSFINPAAEASKTRGSLVAFGEESRSDDFAVAVLGGEPHSGLANTFPASGDRAQVQIGEAPAFGPNSGIKHSNNNVGAIVGFGPETPLVAEAQELRGASGVQMPAAILKSGEDRRVFEGGGGLGGS